MPAILSPSQASITSVRVVERGDELRVSWTATDPPGTWYQVLIDRRRVLSTRSRSVRLPAPASPRRLTGEVVAVDPTQIYADVTASLPPLNDRARLWWYGGLYLSSSIDRYGVFMGLTPGGAVDFSAAVDVVPAYPAGRVSDGAGMGPAGVGGAGSAAATYSWTGGPLAGGTWNLAVVPYDAAGNPGTPKAYAVAVTTPPQAPPPDAAGRRLRGTYDPTTQVLTLNWTLSSP